MPKVGLSTGVERREILRKAAYYIRSETAKQITARPVIMPRVSPPGSEITRTRGDAIRGVLEELIHFHNDEIKYFEFDEIIVCAKPGEIEGMDQFSSAERMKELPIRVENLYDQGPWDEVEIQDAEGNTDTVRVNHRIKDSAFRISVSVPSSDPAFGIYGALQNMIFAVHPADRARLQGVPEELALADDRAAAVSSSLLIPDAVRETVDHPDSYKSSHRTLQDRAAQYRESEDDVGLQYRALYNNLANLAEHVLPDLAFIDGTYVVDGSGERLDGGFALSGDDPVAVDTVLARVLGVDVSGLGHLQYLQQRHYGTADESNIKVARGNPDDLNIPFSLHSDEQRRLSWHHVRLPGEDGEAVGYIAPEQEAEDEVEKDGAEETSSKAEADASDQEAGDGQQESDQDASEAGGEETTTQEATDEGTEAAVEPDEDLDLRERVRRRLIRRGKMEGELPEGAAEAGGSSGTPEPEEEVSASDASPGTGEETGESDGEDEQEQAEQQDEQDETKEPAEQQTEQEVEESDAPADSDRGDGGGGTVSGADVVLEGDDVRERVRNRLIQRGKMEGELPEGIEMPEPTAESGEEAEGSDTAEAEQEQEPEPDEEEADQDADQKKEQQDESSADETGEDEEASSEESSGASDDGEDSGGPVSGEDVIMEGDDVRERVRNRLIQRGKMEGELPDGIESPPTSEKDADTGEGQVETEPSGEEETEGEHQEEQSEDVSQEETGEADGLDDQEPAASTPEKDEDLGTRERIERRLIRRGKMEGELPDDAEQEPEEDAAAEEDTGEAATDDTLPEVEDADHVDETVEVTPSSGPSLEPSEDIVDPQEVLQNLSGYEPEDKIRRRLAIRRKAVQGGAGDNGQATEATDAPEEPSEEPADTSEDHDDQPEEDQKPSEDEEEETDAGDVTGYERDPDAPLRERVEQRLSQRGKL